MESGIAKHSVVIAGRRTSVSLEDEFWKSLRDIAKARHLTVQEQIASIDAARPRGRNLSSAIRLFVLVFYRDRKGEEFPASRHILDDEPHATTLVA